MKTCFAVLVLSIAACCQTSVLTSGGTLVENSDQTLSVALSPVSVYGLGSADGYVSLSTGPMVPGGNPKQHARASTVVASYTEGGSFTISILSTGTIFNGTIDNATFEAEGDRDTSFYTLSGDIESLDGTQTGSFVLTAYTQQFTGSAALANPFTDGWTYSIAVTLD